MGTKAGVVHCDRPPHERPASWNASIVDEVAKVPAILD
jgi:hypothetical protein